MATAASHVIQLQKKQAFLDAYSQCGNITEAAKLAKIDRTTHYDWLTRDPEYPERFKNAENQAIDSLEKEAWRRAVEGVEEPVGWHQGVAGGTVRRYSDTLLIFLLKGARPERYRENIRQEITGPNGTTPVINFSVAKALKDGEESS
jgi:hypothetical protein